MKYILEIDFETERHCLLCPVRDEETDDCKMQYCGEGFESWKEQMINCPLKLVEEEKHGKWVLHGNDDGLGMTYYCSVCGFSLDEDLFYSDYKDGKWIRNHVFKHCPNCGTKMEE